MTSYTLWASPEAVVLHASHASNKAWLTDATFCCRSLLPVVVFVFSRKRIDQLADNLNSLDLTSASEKAEIHIFVEQSVARLKGGDRRLPQILRLKQMLKRGLAVHHAGKDMQCSAQQAPVPHHASHVLPVVCNEAFAVHHAGCPCTHYW